MFPLRALCFAWLWFLVEKSFARSLTLLSSTTLGEDPQTVNHLNGESFQQDALVTFSGQQYAAFWTPSPDNSSVRHITLSRRSILEIGAEWEHIVFTDYNQTEDDGHDIISLGISRGDGTLHFIFDQHDNPLHYRSSVPGLAFNASANISNPWSTDSFGQIQTILPTNQTLDPNVHFINVTYPRFLSIPPIVSAPQANSSTEEADLLLEFRVGRSGLGDDWLYKYFPGDGAREGRWELVGRYLEGVKNNAYINGLDFDAQGTLHVTWTYRDFINDTGKDVAVQAGPNGPENNHDLVYAQSPDLGRTWYNTWGQQVALLSPGNETANATDSSSDSAPQASGRGGVKSQVGDTIVPTSAGVTVFSIPKYGGILNQEAQTVDWEGRVHVLNRENGTGVERWYHYWRTPPSLDASAPAPAPSWYRAAIPSTVQGDTNNITGTPTVIGKRGKLVSVPAKIPDDVNLSTFTHQELDPLPLPSLSPQNDTQTRNSTDDQSQQSKGTTLLALLPSNQPNSTALTILASNSWNGFADWEVVWSVGEGCGCEVLFDRQRLALGVNGEDGGDSGEVLSLFVVNGTEVQVWDLGFGEM